MKMKLVKLFALTLAIIMLVSVAACQLKDDAAPGDGEADASRDEAAVTIGGAYTITKGEVEDAYNNMVAQYQYYGMSAPTADADIETMQDAVVDMLISEQIQLYQADQMGIDVDEEMRSQIEADTEDELMELTQMFRSQAESEGAEDVEAHTTEIFNEQLTAAGLDMDVEGYRAYVREQIEMESRINALMEMVKGEVNVSEEEAKAYYDELLATQKEAYEADAAAYLEAQENYEKFGGDPILVTPEGYIRVKTITISPQEEISDDYEILESELTALEAEFGSLSLNEPGKNAARIAQIRTEYAEKRTEADKLFDDYTAAAKEKVDKAYAALQEGASFDEALAEYGEDDVYKTYPIFASEGLLMLKGEATSTWPAEVVEAVDKLEAGAYTPVIQAGDMFYIAQLVGDEQAGETAYEDVQEEMERLAKETKAEDHWNERLDSWVNDAELVVRNVDVYRGIGK